MLTDLQIVDTKLKIFASGDRTRGYQPSSYSDGIGAGTRRNPRRASGEVGGRAPGILSLPGSAATRLLSIFAYRS